MEFKDYVRILRDRKWIIVGATVVATAVALALSFVQAPVYRGQAQVLVQTQNRGAVLLGDQVVQSMQPERDLATQVRLVQLTPLVEKAIRELGLNTTPEQLLQRTDVSADGQTSVITIAVQDSSPERAAATANALAAAYVDYSRSLERASIAAAVSQVELSLKQARQRIADLTAQAASDPSGVKRAELTVEQQLYASLSQKYQDLTLNEQLATGLGSVVASASPDFKKVSPSPLRNGIIGLVLGLSFGVGLAFLINALDATVQTAEDAAEILHAPVLAELGMDREAGELRRLVVRSDAESALAEGYRGLRNNLNYINFEHNIKAIMVVSAGPSEGKSTVAANLAAVLAQAGWKTALVVSDFRKPTVSQFFGVDDRVGLSDVLSGAKDTQTALQKVPGANELFVLAPGPMPANPSELLGSGQMQELVTGLESWANYVVIDTPPLLAVADATAVAPLSDGVIVVVRMGVTRRDALRRAHSQLEGVGARILGVVVWGVSKPDASGGYGYYGSYRDATAGGGDA